MDVLEMTAGLGVPRPTRSDAARNYDALIAAGRAAFAEQGSAAALEDIARRAGVGIGTLYRNFPTRDALVETLYVQEVSDVARAAEDQHGEPWDALEQWLHRFVQYVGTKQALVEGLNRDSAVFGACRAVLYRSGEPLLERAQEAGEARADLTISDVIRLVSSAAVGAYEDEAQRERVTGLAIGAIRAR